MEDNYVLEISGVNKTFGGLKALSNINLKVKEGTTHAIIGPNGAGKSTLLNTCIAKLVPDSGSIMFAGQDLTDGMVLISWVYHVCSRLRKFFRNYPCYITS